MISQKNARWLVLLAAGLVLTLTLMPSSALNEPHRFVCVWCGARATADMTANVVLFIPLGVALALWLPGKIKPVIVAVALTSAIELAQVFIPGRDPNFDDVLSNTLGGLAGVLLASAPGLWLVPPPQWRRAYAAAGTALAVAMLAIGGSLLRPAFQEGVYYGQWTADLGYLEWYRGQVIRSQIGDIPVHSRKIRRTDEVRELLFQGAPVQVEAIAGPTVPALAPIFSIYDEHEREVLLLGTDRADAVLRYRMRASKVKLDEPDLRFRDAFANIKTGDPLRLEAMRAGRGYCITVNAERSCKVGLTVADTWGLLFFLSSFPGWMRSLLGVIWIAGLLMPAGFWLDRKTDIPIVGGAAVAALAIIPRFTPLLNTEWIHYAAALAGVLLGLALRRAVQRWLPLRSGPWDASRTPSERASVRTQRSMRS